jgi:hypothetical protein
LSLNSVFNLSSISKSNIEDPTGKVIQKRITVSIPENTFSDGVIDSIELLKSSSNSFDSNAESIQIQPIKGHAQGLNEKTFSFVDSYRDTNTSTYYYLRVFGSDGDILVSSPSNVFNNVWEDKLIIGTLGNLINDNSTVLYNNSGKAIGVNLNLNLYKGSCSGIIENMQILRNEKVIGIVPIKNTVDNYIGTVSSSYCKVSYYDPIASPDTYNYSIKLVAIDRTYSISNSTVSITVLDKLIPSYSLDFISAVPNYLPNGKQNGGIITIEVTHISGVGIDELVIWKNNTILDSKEISLVSNSKIISFIDPSLTPSDMLLNSIVYSTYASNKVYNIQSDNTSVNINFTTNPIYFSRYGSMFSFLKKITANSLSYTIEFGCVNPKILINNFTENGSSYTFDIAAFSNLLPVAGESSSLRVPGNSGFPITNNKRFPELVELSEFGNTFSERIFNVFNSVTNKIFLPNEVIYVSIYDFSLNIEYVYKCISDNNGILDTITILGQYDLVEKKFDATLLDEPILNIVTSGINKNNYMIISNPDELIIQSFPRCYHTTSNDKFCHGVATSSDEIKANPFYDDWFFEVSYNNEDILLGEDTNDDFSNIPTSGESYEDYPYGGNVVVDDSISDSDQASDINPESLSNKFSLIYRGKDNVFILPNPGYNIKYFNIQMVIDFNIQLVFSSIKVNKDAIKMVAMTSGDSDEKIFERQFKQT